MNLLQIKIAGVVAVDEWLDNEDLGLIKVEILKNGSYRRTYLHN